jgi:flagellar secretion chaperone FliS
MRSNHIGRQYRELAVKSATPVGLIIFLYDFAIEALLRASREIDAGNIEGRTVELNYCLSVISELQRSLNFDEGGDVAKRLMDLYDVSRAKILEANIKSSKEIIERLAQVLASIREAWQAVEEKTAGKTGAEPAAEAPCMTSAAPSPAPPEGEESNLRWSA